MTTEPNLLALWHGKEKKRSSEHVVGRIKLNELLNIGRRRLDTLDRLPRAEKSPESNRAAQVP